MPTEFKAATFEHFGPNFELRFRIVQHNTGNFFKLMTGDEVLLNLFYNDGTDTEQHLYFRKKDESVKKTKVVSKGGWADHHIKFYNGILKWYFDKNLVWELDTGMDRSYIFKDVTLWFGKGTSVASGEIIHFTVAADNKSTDSEEPECN